MDITKLKFNTGFTLIELMIAVAIIGILASIALPSYQEHVQTSRRTDARDALINAAQTLERQYTSTNAYTGGTLVKDTPFSSPGGYYSVTATELTTGAYTLVSTAKPPQDKDLTCKVMTITHTGTKSPAACW
ncbi:type IV pilin protein [Shewanella submarina]|uniref:Type IV pilin protein n=1 Tax=Shewanella submarina TaxID=2016376 RepID=A0ABV7G8Z5_9GAMM|nr:type IV pilin protein [Shewanella submarina]MCL1038494.1 type IV pilin protein [Shewanella submarina]